MYYPKTVGQIRRRIEREYPGTKARYKDLRKDEIVPPSHLLWMCREIENMNTVSIDSAVKAGRWLGWILAHMESRGLWDNRTSRRLVRSDHKKAFDKPHQK